MSVLGVPVDHRLRGIIRKLMKLNQTPSSPRPPSHHSERLRQLSQSLHHRGWLISEDEVDFACYLAEPASQGGIVVALTQPAPNQDYSISTDDIVQDCNTLLALRMLAEFFSLAFDKLSVFDAYPFTTEKKLDPEDIDHCESHTTFHKMILEKRPTVILSGWTSPSFKNFATRSLQKQAIGTVFESPKIHYHGLNLTRVNMPHPSYYMNYHPTESCFRQLQVLEFAQACGRSWGIWQEKIWMADLRARCRARAKLLFDNQRDSYGDTYLTERLTQIFTQLGPVIAGMHYGFSSKAEIEDQISENNFLELCSDASLILHHVNAIEGDEGDECGEASMAFLCSWYDRRWPTLSELSVPVSTGFKGLYDRDCFDRNIVLDLPPLAQQIEFCLVKFARQMNLSWTACGDDTFEPHFDAQASAFHDLAQAVEDAMDEIPNNHSVQPIATSKDVAPESLMKLLAELGV